MSTRDETMKDLLKVLACTRCKGNLDYKKTHLVCTKCRLKYSIIDGIPDMLPEHAEKV
ncbi:MAG: Trm112 family protein [Candidatus Aenigmarchaeota archaeon]|nr:Trm112 family protein [Candidatus Aenigmarchaeota archaeon]